MGSVFSGIGHRIDVNNDGLAAIPFNLTIVLDEADKGSPLEMHQAIQSPIHKFYEDDVYFDIFDKILFGPNSKKYDTPSLIILFIVFSHWTGEGICRN